jgi:uncharacterized protein
MSGRPLALVTGASSGIGAALAKELASRGHDLLLVARNEDALQRLAADLRDRAGIAADVLPADLALPGAGRALTQELKGREISVETVVNSAGFADFARFVDADLDKLQQMVAVNVAALTEITHELLPDMLTRGRGRVLNVASTAGFMPGPLMAVYYATKAYVLSLTEALAEELKGTGVSATALCPGPTETGFQSRAAMEESKLVKGRTIMDAATVARAGIDGLMVGKPVVVPGWKNKFQAAVPHFVPRRLLTATVMRAQDVAARDGSGH